MYPGDHPSDALGRAARRVEMSGAISLGGGVGVERQGGREKPTYAVIKGRRSHPAPGPLAAVTRAFAHAGAMEHPATPGGKRSIKDPSTAARLHELEAERRQAEQTLAAPTGGVLADRFDQRQRERAQETLRTNAAERNRLLRQEKASAAMSIGEAIAGQLEEHTDEELMQEAKDSMAKASTPEPFSTSKTSNWVARAGGLPAYIQHIAHDLVEKRGKTESNAIQMAIGIVKNWASGQGKVDANTRAAASKAVAQWEAMKAKNAAGKAAKSATTASLLEGVFDEAKHPRSHGRWIAKLGGMPNGSTAHIANVKVERNARGDFTVHHPPGSPRALNMGDPTRGAPDPNLASPSVAADSLAKAAEHAKNPTAQAARVRQGKAPLLPGTRSSRAENEGNAIAKKALAASDHPPYIVVPGASGKHHVRGAAGGGKSLPMSAQDAHARATELNKQTVADLNAKGNKKGDYFSHTRMADGTHAIVKGKGAKLKKGERVVSSLLEHVLS